MSSVFSVFFVSSCVSFLESPPENRLLSLIRRWGRKRGGGKKGKGRAGVGGRAGVASSRLPRLNRFLLSFSDPSPSFLAPERGKRKKKKSWSSKEEKNVCANFLVLALEAHASFPLERKKKDHRSLAAFPSSEPINCNQSRANFGGRRKKSPWWGKLKLQLPGTCVDLRFPRPPRPKGREGGKKPGGKPRLIPESPDRAGSAILVKGGEKKIVFGGKIDLPFLAPPPSPIKIGCRSVSERRRKRKKKETKRIVPHSFLPDAALSPSLPLECRHRGGKGL